MSTDTSVPNSSGCVKTQEEKKITRIHNGQKLLDCDNKQLSNFIESLSPAANHNRTSLGEDFRNKIKRTEFQVLKHLASCCHYGRRINTIKSRVFPGRQIIAESLGVTTKTVDRAIDGLVNKNLITKKEPDDNNKNSNEYFFTERLKDLAQATEMLKVRLPVPQKIKDSLEEKYDERKTESQKNAKLGTPVAKIKDEMKLLLKSLEQKKIDGLEYVTKLKELEMKIASIKIRSSENVVNSPITVLKLINHVPPRGTKSPLEGDKKSPEGDKKSPEILSKSSDNENNKLTTTKSKLEKKTNAVQVSSSLVKYFSSLGFKFSKQHLQKYLDFTEEATEKDFKNGFEELKNSLIQYKVTQKGHTYLGLEFNLWHCFVLSTFSVNRFFEDINTIALGIINDEIPELIQRAKTSTLLGFKDFKKRFKTEEEAIKSIFLKVDGGHKKNDKEPKQNEQAVKTEQVAAIVAQIKKDSHNNSEGAVFNENLAQECAKYLLKGPQGFDWTLEFSVVHGSWPAYCKFLKQEGGQ